MEHKSLFAITLLVVLVAGSAISQEPETATEIYHIDYRGPETHTSLSPPDLSWADPNNKHSGYTNKGGHSQREPHHG